MKTKLNKPQVIADKIEKRIHSGEWSKNESIPGERKLAEQYDVSYMTMRQAINLLVAKSTLRKEHGAGTFVQEAPKYQIGLLMGFPTEEMMLSPVVKVLLEQIRTLLDKNDVELRSYVFFGHKRIEDEIQYPFFIDDIRKGRIKALIVEPVIYKEELVRIHSEMIPVTIPSATDLQLNTVHLDLDGLGRSAIDYLASRKVRKIAVFDSLLKFAVGGRKLLSDMPMAIMQTAKNHGIPQDRITFFMNDKDDLERIIPEILGGVYDGVIFNNDFLARRLMEILGTMGKGLEKKMAIVSLSNLGAPVLDAYSGKICRYEFDPQDMARDLISLAVESSCQKGRKIRRCCVRGRFIPA